MFKAANDGKCVLKSIKAAFVRQIGMFVFTNGAALSKRKSRNKAPMLLFRTGTPFSI
jgi:hypothetical protein